MLSNMKTDDKADKIKFFEGKARDKNPILIIEKDGNPLYLFSKYNPVKEAERQADNINIKEEHIVIIGGGSPYFLKEVLRKIPPDKRVFYLEPYPELFSFVVKHLDLGKLIKKFNYFSILLPENENFEKSLQEGIDIVRLDKIDYIIHPIADKLFNKEINGILERINKTALQIVYDFVTRMKDGKRVQKNILKNIDIIVKAPPINKLKNLFKDIPAIIVSAGPSLDKNIVYLKDMEKRGIIISTDTALKPLLSADIEPHFVVAGDPSYFNYLHLKDVFPEKTFFITEPSVDHRVFQYFGDKTFITIFDKPLLELIEKRIGEIAHLNTWGTVASLALELAHFIGSSPIFFIGQDFSFSYNLKYTRKTTYDNDWIFKRDNYSYFDSKKNMISNSKNKRQTEDIFKRKVYTDYKLENYKEYVESVFKDRDYINITEGGIFEKPENSIARFNIMSLKYGKRDFFDDIGKIHYQKENKSKVKNIESLFKLIIKKLKEIIEECSKNLEIIEKDNYLTEEKLSKAYYFLYENSEIAEIIENYTQEPIYQLLREQNRYKKSGDFDGLIKAYKDYYNKIILLIEEITDDFKNSYNILKSGGIR